MRSFIRPKLIILIALLAGFASPALAEGSSAMHYTHIQETAPDSGTTHIRIRRRSARTKNRQKKKNRRRSASGTNTRPSPPASRK